MQGPAREVFALLQQWDADDDPQPLVVETSGSTGEPKSVVLSRKAMRASAVATESRIGGPGQWLLNLPPTHVAGVQVLFRSVVAGTEPVFLDEHHSFAAAARAMTGGRRYLSLVPTQLSRMLASSVDREALRSFDTVLVGGAAVERDMRRAAASAGITVVATYGMSETCGGCVYDGVPLDGVAVKIDDEGRIRIAGPVLFDRYDGDLQLTGRVKERGWFLTSDLGRLNDDGVLEVLGRVDDVINSGGVKVPSHAVASRLRQHPSIGAAEVVGVPDPDWGQRVVAVVVSAPQLSAPEVPQLDTLRNWVSQVHPRTWAPHQLLRVPEIPLLPNGKVDRLAVARIVEEHA